MTVAILLDILFSLHGYGAGIARGGINHFADVEAVREKVVGSSSMFSFVGAGDLYRTRKQPGKVFITGLGGRGINCEYPNTVIDSRLTRNNSTKLSRRTALAHINSTNIFAVNKLGE